MIGYLQSLLSRVGAYVYYLCSRGKPETLKTTLLDPREPIFDEEYLEKKDMKELDQIFAYVREKEKAFKRKCKQN